LQLALTAIPGKIGSGIGLVLLSLGAFLSLFNVMNIGIFKSPVSVITLSTTVQSNAQEVKEFLQTYGVQLARNAGLFLLVTVTLIGLYRKALRPISFKPALSALLLSVLCILPVLHRSGGSLKQVALDVHELAYIDRLATTFMRYQGIMQAREKAKAFWSQRANIRDRMKLETRHAMLPPIILVVIGESTTRRHMGIYGYHRPTTPALESLKDQLLVFPNTTAPVASTLPGVIGALCSAGFDRDSLECTGPTLIEIAQAAGYQTAWISNQAPSGFGDNFIVELGRTADATYFVNQDVSSAGEADNSSSFDEKVLTPLDQVLRSSLQNQQKTMIFVHLMGTHFIYEKRYPKTERRFHGTDDVRLPDFIKDPKAKSIINHYDNAIAYQDKLLGGIMERLNASQQDAVFVYFSDHGEEVFNNDNFAGHSEDRVTPAMREVPFIIGYSQSYAQNRKTELARLRKQIERPFSTFQLTPSVAGLLGLKADVFSQNDNIFSESFLPDRGAMRASSSTPSRPPHLQK
jgi:heptose-I-phosphate ethanolaminephosphotransferase